MSLVGTLGRDETTIRDRSGREYRLARPTLGAILAVEREYRKHQPGPLAKAAMNAKYVPAEQAAAYWAEAYKAEAKAADSNFLIECPAIYQLPVTALLLLHRYHGHEISTFEQATEWLTNVDVDEFQQASLTINPPKPHVRPPVAPASTGPTSSGA